jgi:chromosome segregation ATPase
MFDWLKSLLSPDRRFREAVARQADATVTRNLDLHRHLNAAVEERDKARGEAAAATRALTAFQAQADHLGNLWRSSESKLALADAENARLHVELDAATARYAELAGRVDAAEAVRDRAITDMNHWFDELKAAKAERDLSREQVGKLVEAAGRMVADVRGLEEMVGEWVRGVVERATRDVGRAAAAAMPPRDEVKGTEAAVKMKGPLPVTFTIDGKVHGV